MSKRDFVEESYDDLDLVKNLTRKSLLYGNNGLKDSFERKASKKGFYSESRQIWLYDEDVVKKMCDTYEGQFVELEEEKKHYTLPDDNEDVLAHVKSLNCSIPVLSLPAEEIAFVCGEAGVSLDDKVLLSYLSDESVLRLTKDCATEVIKERYSHRKK